MQTRIRVVEDSLGNLSFYPQCRWALIWWGLDDGYGWNLSCRSAEEAKCALDEYVKAANYKRRVREYTLVE